jgi:hypothetical protein
MRLLYTGTSLLDPTAPIFVAATDESDNRKTGPMVQVWIMRQDVHPLQAVRTGEDQAVCGDCALRGERGKDRVCYVTVQHAPAAVYRAWKAGTFEDLRTDVDPFIGEIVRVGAYGDPAALPFDFWNTRLFSAKGWTAYTHQWRTCDQRYRHLAMASVDTIADAHEAWAWGWRTFRVRGEHSGLLLDEIVCPASEEAGHKTTCARCQLCNGRQHGADHRKDIAILAHRTPGVFARQAQGALPF